MTDADHPARILLVDDSVMDVELTLNAWREVHGPCRVEVARSGGEAVARVQHWAKSIGDPECPPPDLILLDLKMPGTDGFEVLRHFKGTPGLRRTPVIILTSSREDEDRALAYDLGANSYLLKPVSFEGFLSTIRAIHDFWLGLNIRPPMTGPYA